ncbi:MAG: homoserine dehydrogenase, partial [Pseudomonadota bacterium]
ARAVLHGKADMVPLDRPVAEVCAVAKRDLVPGERLDQIGEYCYRAWTMETAAARQSRAIPCGLLTDCTVTAPIQKGALITYTNTAVPEGSRIAKLRARQDAMLGLELADA